MRCLSMETFIKDGLSYTTDLVLYRFKIPNSGLLLANCLVPGLSLVKSSELAGSHGDFKLLDLVQGGEGSVGEVQLLMHIKYS